MVIVTNSATTTQPGWFIFHYRVEFVYFVSVDLDMSQFLRASQFIPQLQFILEV